MTRESTISTYQPNSYDLILFYKLIRQRIMGCNDVSIQNSHFLCEKRNDENSKGTLSCVYNRTEWANFMTEKFS